MQINFIDWVSFKEIPLFDGAMTLAEYCAQYSAVQTNWVYTIAAIVGILTLIIDTISPLFTSREISLMA